MTSLAVEFTYNNLNASKGRHQMTLLNHDNAAINNTSNNNNNTTTHRNNNNSSNNATLNNNNNNNNNSNNSFSNLINNNNAPYNHLSTIKIPSPNTIYNLKSGDGVAANATISMNETR